MKYFITDYVPYVLLSRSVLFSVHNPEENVGNNYKILYYIKKKFNVHPNSINLEDVKEFEMYIYDSEYYLNIYSNYKKLRNGKIIIPRGQHPNFYWSGDKLIRAFV